MASKERVRGKRAPKPKIIGDPDRATGISNRPRGEEAEEQKHVHPSGKALGDPDETGERGDREEE
jgi:hypothetical protein